ncbi:MAG: hypothetical protein J1E29_06015, partial [Duncaniella sp.]|nr:hypothetical protein [Duncaniella sp.]
MRKILLAVLPMALCAIGAAAATSTVEYVVKVGTRTADSDGYVLHAGDLLETEGTAVVIKANHNASAQGNIVATGKFSDNTEAGIFGNVAENSRMSGDPSASNPTCSPQSGVKATSFNVVVKKPITDFRIYFCAADGSRKFKWFSVTDSKKQSDPENGVVSTENVVGSNKGFICTIASIAPGEYTIYQTGFTGGCLGFKYKVEEDDEEEPDTRITPTVKWSESSCTANIRETVNTYPTLTLEAEEGTIVSYSSSDENVAKISETGEITLVARGTTVITASVPETETMYSGSASYTLTVLDPVADLRDLLAKAISDADSRYLDIYSEATAQALAAPLAAAKSALQSDDATTLQTALDNLNNALSELVTICNSSATYAVQLDETHKAGDSVDVTLDDETVATLTFGFEGGNDFNKAKKAEKDSALEGFVAYTEGNGQNGAADSGTTYIIEPKYDGQIEVGVILNADKSFFILQDEVAIPYYDAYTEAEKKYTKYTFDVKANSVYKVYATGTKLGFYGFNYSFIKDQNPLADVKSDLKEALAAAEGIDWDLYTEDAAKALYNAICEAKEVLASDTAGETDFTNATSALKNAFDALDDNLAEQNLPTISGPGMYSFFDWTQTNTHDNLKYDAADSKTSGWSDVEKDADAKEDKDPTEASKDNCFWLASDTRDENGYLTVKNAQYASDDSQPESVIIPELYGLEFLDGAFGRSLAIAVNYPTTSLGTYKGGSYLWFGASNGADYLVIPNVEAGSIITMGVESHKTTDQRGIELYVYNNGTKGAKLKNQYGYDVVTPTTYKNSTWLVPDAPAAIDDDDANAVERYDILLHNTAGCHVYYIDAAVEQGPTTAITEVKAEETDAPVVYYNL